MQNAELRISIMININAEMIKKAKTAKSADELLKIAKENGINLTFDEANTYFAQLNSTSDELSDDELVNVSGGCNNSSGKEDNDDYEDKNQWLVFSKI
jgi:predicted ribosomally synthesized peptide with nif11-like leader